MNWFTKIAQVSLQEGQDSRDSSKIYFLSGNTYPIKEQIGRKGLGFRWYRAKKFWWLPAHKVTPQIIRGLNDLGINTSAIADETTGEFPVELNTSITQPAQAEPEKRIIDQRPGDPDARTAFPVKDNIYSEVIQVEILEQTIPLTLQLNRRAKTGGDRYKTTYPLGWRKFPKYNISIIFGEDEIMRTALPINKGRDKTPGSEGRTFQSINEDQEILPLFKEVINKIPEVLTNPKNKLRQRLEYKVQVNQRDPEFAQFLEDIYIGNRETGHPDIKINIPLPGYEGEFPVLLKKMSGDTLHANTALKHPLAPHPSIIASIMFPEETKTIEEFMAWVNTLTTNPEFMRQAQPRYIKYLQSFAFSSEEQEEERAELDEILPFIQNKSMDMEHYRQKMISLGYIRPSKRQKKTGPGMMPQGDIQFILDKKRIIEDGYYPEGRMKNSAKFFYALIAYHMHRLKSGNIGFVPLAISDNLRDFSRTLEKHGVDINYSELYDYTETVARVLLQEITGQRPKGTAWDNYQQFYAGDEETTGPEMNIPSNALEEFIMFVSNLGANSRTNNAQTQKRHI